MARKGSTLSIFIDESGDFGELQERPAYYLVTLVFHDQSRDISDNVKKLKSSIKNKTRRKQVKQIRNRIFLQTAGAKENIYQGNRQKEY